MHGLKVWDMPLGTESKKRRRSFHFEPYIRAGVKDKVKKLCGIENISEQHLCPLSALAKALNAKNQPHHIIRSLGIKSAYVTILFCAEERGNYVTFPPEKEFLLTYLSNFYNRRHYEIHQ